MNTNENDWKLTAYALGELDEVDRAEVQARLAASPDLASELEDIRATIGILERELATTDSPKFEPYAGTTATATTGHSPLRSRSRRIWIPTAVAASIALVGVGAWMNLPHLSRSRELSPALAQRSVENAPEPSSQPRTRPVTTNDVDESESKSYGFNPVASANRDSDYSSATSASIGGDSELLATIHFDRVIPGELDSQVVEALRAQREFKEKLASLGYIRFADNSPGRETPPIEYNSDIEVHYGLTQEVQEKLTSLGYIGFADNSPERPIRACRGAIGRMEPGAQLTRMIRLDFRDGEDCSFGYEVPFGSETSLSERYSTPIENPYILVEAEPLSTFSIGVNTASYSNVRRILSTGKLPPPDAVRIEEMINYFTYEDPPPTGEHPFSVSVEVAECPWAMDHRLARIGLKGYELAAHERPSANLVFLIDVSGSMEASNRLPLVREAMNLLVDQLRPDDMVGIVTYAGNSGIKLSPNYGSNKAAIRDAIDGLSAGGSTNAGAGIQTAYELAEAYFIEGGVNRVILATDGDFNVGMTGMGDLKRLIEEKAASGVFLTVLGVGMGNYQDAALEMLANSGNGNHAYLDTIEEARKVLVDQIGGTLVTIAKDVKIQVEFNPSEVSAYRLVGYENRLLAARDFNNDKKDAGEIGAGHSVTALYEIVPAGGAVETSSVDPLRYQSPMQPSAHANSGEMMTVKLRYKLPDGDTSTLIEMPLFDDGFTFAESSDDLAFAAAVASFGMILRRSQLVEYLDYATVIELAEGAIGEDPFGYRAEFVNLVRMASQIDPPQ